MHNNKVSRRHFLRGLGAVTIIAASGTVWRAVDQGVFSSGTGSAFTPWETWQQENLTGSLVLVQAGILAASPHNTQPWLFHVTETQIDLYANEVRHLGSMDPYRREMYIGLGCALENMLLAAAAVGYTTTLTLHPGKLPIPVDRPMLVATITLTPGPALISPFYTAIPNRHTNRYEYTVQPVPEALLAELASLNEDDNLRVFLLRSEDPFFQSFADTTQQATAQIIANEEMAQDSFQWIRQSWEDVHTYRDGLYIDTAGVSPFIRAISKITPPMSRQTMDAGWLSSTETTLAATAVFGMITVRDLYDRVQALQAGRLWQRIHLWATNQGLAVQPLNQMPEIVDYLHQSGQQTPISDFLTTVTGDQAWQTTFAFRLGYPTTTPLASARRALTDVLL